MSAGRARGLAVLAAMLMAAACGGEPGPTAGTVYLTVTGPAARSIQVRIAGAAVAISDGSANVRQYAAPLGGDTLMVVAIADAGHTLSEGPVATLLVSDVAAALSYSVQIVQVANASYALQNPVQYTVSITQSP